MGSDYIADLAHFPRFWYINAPRWWWRFTKRLLTNLDNQLAVRVMLRFWLVPVWQDKTVIGRGLSLIFRTSRIIIGGAVIIAAVIAELFWITVWLLLPILLLLSVPSAILVLLLLWVIDASLQVAVRLRDPVRLALIEAKADTNRLQVEVLKHPDAQLILQMIEKADVPSLPLTITVDELINKAKQVEKDVGDNQLRMEHLLLVILAQQKFHEADAIEAYTFLKKKRRWGRHPWIWEDDYDIRPIGGVNRAWTGLMTPELNRVSTDLTALAAKGKIPELIGRQKEVEEIVRILGREGRENVMMIGEPGTGKTTIVEALANEIIRGTEFSGLRFKRLMALDIAALTAGSMGKVKERIVKIIDEIREAGNIILVIDEIHSLVAADESQTTSVVFSALEPHLNAGEFQFIATTTPGGNKRFIEPSEAFSRTFRQILLPEANVQEAQEIAEGKAFELEQAQGVSITYSAVKLAVELARRYIHDRFLPDSAIDLLEETVNKNAKTGKTVTAQTVEEMVTEKTKIPVRAADSKQEKTILLNLEKALHKRIVGQDTAVTALSDALRRARAGFAEEGKLLASFLFAGPTGVGKTETAKALAEVYFGSQKSMVRLDMSEYQTQESINRLIGPPPGKPGHELGGQLTEAVRRRPFTVILLDEIEKADVRIMDVFLQLLDDARLTDGMGRTVDFANTIVIATSNVGTKSLLEGTEKGDAFEQLKDGVLNALREKFRPEFLNRFSGIIVYKPLTQEQVKEIAKLLLNSLIEKMGKKEITIELSDELIEHLAKKGYNPLWGVRELRRIVSDEVEEKIAQKLLEEKMKPGQKYTLTSEFLS